MSDTHLVFGIHAVQAVLSKHPQRVRAIWMSNERGDDRIRNIRTLAQTHAVQIVPTSLRELDARSSNERHQGVIAELKPQGNLGEGALDELLDNAGNAPLLLILDGVQDPHNLGACMRTADAAGVCAIVVPRDRAVGLNATVRKVASGAAESIPLVQVTNLARTLAWLKERGLWLVGADDGAGQSVYQAKLTGALAIVMGAEGTGMRRLTREHCDLLVSIPMAGIVESLNVSVATGIVLYEAVRQRTAI